VLEEKLHQTEKLSAIGQLAAGVAHEINNPLGVILGFAQGMDRRVPEQDPLRLPVTSIVRESLRCKALVQELLTFSRTAKKVLEEVDVNSLIRATGLLLESRAKTQNVQVVYQLSEKDLIVKANRTQLQQIIVNLGTNSLDAMSNGGTLTIHTSRNEQGDVDLKVIDTGSGIPPSIRSRIFEPFFTTKEVGKGTGLGLSLVYEIVQQHGGEINVQSNEGKETAFFIRIPGAPMTEGTV